MNMMEESLPIFDYIMTMINEYSFLLAIVVALIGMVYFAINYYKANRDVNQNRKTIQEDIINKSIIILPRREYAVVCAGSNNDENICEKVVTVDIKECNFLDSDGNPLNVDLYDCYIVHGDSMKYAGIHDGDFVFVPKANSMDTLYELKKPAILVIKYRDDSPNKPKFKIRRAWYSGNINDDLISVIKGIMEFDSFKELKNQIGYKDDEWMITDFQNKRLGEEGKEGYKLHYFENGKCKSEFERIIISTTFDTMEKKIHFSIHPFSYIVGNVEYAYTVKK